MSAGANILQDCMFIVWDKCTMSHEAALETWDEELQHLRRNTSALGGVAVLLVGEFPQNIRAIPRGTDRDQLQACMKWSHIDYGVNYEMLPEDKYPSTLTVFKKLNKLKFCNCNRFTVKRLHNFVNEARFVTGHDRETNAFIAVISIMHVPQEYSHFRCFTSHEF
jgi:polyferredoxin